MEKLNVKQAGEVFITMTIFPYGFALLARKGKLICRFIEDLRNLDCAGRAR